MAKARKKRQKTARAKSDGARKQSKNASGATLGFEATLWSAADKLRGHMDAAEYKHVVLGLIFLKYISDAFTEVHTRVADEEYADPEDRDEYTAQNVFWVPKPARWPHLRANAKQPTIGRIVDDAMIAIENENPSLKGLLPKKPKDYARPALDKHRLGELIDLLSAIGFGDEASRSKDILGRVYDPCCGSAGMFVQSENFVLAHGGRVRRRKGDGSLLCEAPFGPFRQKTPVPFSPSKMNLAIRGIDTNLGPHHADSFHSDLHPDLKADFVLANPPFNDSDWGGDRLRKDKRWRFGPPPAGNANYAWISHFIHHLAPHGLARFVMANGSMSSSQSGEGEIREAIIEADLVDCIIAMPGQLFFTTAIPVCLWLIARGKSSRARSAPVPFLESSICPRSSNS